MKLRHINSNEIIDTFPYYTKINSIYGYILLTFDNKVIFFWTSEGDLFYTNVTGDYEIITKQ